MRPDRARPFLVGARLADLIRGFQGPEELLELRFEQQTSYISIYLFIYYFYFLLLQNY